MPEIAPYRGGDCPSLFLRLSGNFCTPVNILLHSDRSRQYAATCHRKLLKRFDIQQSMSRIGNCWITGLLKAFSIYALWVHLEI